MLTNNEYEYKKKRIERPPATIGLSTENAVCPIDDDSGDTVAVVIPNSEGARAIRARQFRSERERYGSYRRRPTAQQDLTWGRFYNALPERRTGSHAQPQCLSAQRTLSRGSCRLSTSD